MAEQAATPTFEKLGLVWITGPYHSSAPGLRKALEAVTDVHLGSEPPTVAPSSIVLFPDGEPGSEVRRLGEVAPGAPVVVFSDPPNLELARTTLRAGARGVVHAGMEPAQMVRSLRLASEGKQVIPRRFLEEIIAEESPVDSLSQRGREILGLVAEGLTNIQIARRLYLTESTVKQHLSKAYKVLGVENRRQAARLFRDSETSAVR